MIIERDGAYPPFGELLDELAQARACVARGRVRHAPMGEPQRAVAALLRPDASAMSMEAFLARLYTQPALRSAFLADAAAVARAQQLSAAATASIIAIDREGLALAADSLLAKRQAGRTGVTADSAAG